MLAWQGQLSAASIAGIPLGILALRHVNEKLVLTVLGLVIVGYAVYALTNPQHTPWAVPNRVLYHDVPCKFCYKSVCPQGHHDCLRRVAPPEARAASHPPSPSRGRRRGSRPPADRPPLAARAFPHPSRRCRGPTRPERRWLLRHRVRLLGHQLRDGQ